MEIEPEMTTRSKSLGAEDVINVVFDSPVELDSARLEITDTAGVPVAVDDQALDLLSSGRHKPFRYRLLWNGPWTGLAAGSYGVKVRASDHAGVRLSSPLYERIRLIESPRTNPSR